MWRFLKNVQINKHQEFCFNLSDCLWEKVWNLWFIDIDFYWRSSLRSFTLSILHYFCWWMQTSRGWYLHELQWGNFLFKFNSVIAVSLGKLLNWKNNKGKFGICLEFGYRIGWNQGQQICFDYESNSFFKVK